MLPHNIQNDIISRVRPGKHYTADLRRAVEQCFTFADAVDRQRRSLGADLHLNRDARRDELGRFITTDLFQPLANALEPARRLRAHVERQRGKSGDLPRDVAELNQDVAAVEAALSFAKRELGDHATDISAFDLDGLLTPAAGT